MLRALLACDSRQGVPDARLDHEGLRSIASSSRIPIRIDGNLFLLNGYQVQYCVPFPMTHDDGSPSPCYIPVLVLRHVAFSLKGLQRHSSQGSVTCHVHWPCSDSVSRELYLSVSAGIFLNFMDKIKYGKEVRWREKKIMASLLRQFAAR